jgi:hypothetical protein
MEASLKVNDRTLANKIATGAFSAVFPAMHGRDRRPRDAFDR